MGAGKDHGDVCAAATNAANAVGAEASGQPFALDASGAVVKMATAEDAASFAALGECANCDPVCEPFKSADEDETASPEEPLSEPVSDVEPEADPVAPKKAAAPKKAPKKK